MSEFAKVTQPLKSLKQQDPSKFWAKMQSVFWGLLVVALGIVGLAKYGFNQYLVVVLVFAGGIIASGEIVKAPLKAAIALGKDAVSVIRGKNGSST